MIKNFLRQLKEEHRQAFQEQKGQSIIIITFAFLGLVAMLGLALDLGLVYIEQVRISRTTDAAALAAVVELPFEEESMRRAIEYIQLNGYRVGEDTEIRVRGCINRPSGLKNVSSTELTAGATIPLTPTNSITDSWVYIPAGASPRATFVIDTLGFESVEYNTNGTVRTTNQEVCTGTVGNTNASYGSANKLRVAGKVNVQMNFMQFFGFRRVPVQDDAVGENVTNLDIIVVFDKSGSMDYETNCFGCWNPYPSGHANYDVIANPYPLNGNFSPLTRSDNTNICTGAPAYVSDTQSKRYLVHEAEYYSKEGPLPQGWLYSQRIPGRGYWALQKRGGFGSNSAYIRAHPLVTYSQSPINEYPQLQGASYNDECFSTGICWKARAEQLGEQTATKDEVPYVEYDFTPQWTEPTHIWVRSIGGSGYSFEWYGYSPKLVAGGTMLPWRESLYWQVSSGVLSTTVAGGPWDNLNSYGTSGKEGVQSNDDWRWIKLGSVSGLTNGQQATLRLYQGSSGFNIDKIIFTNNSGGSIGDAMPNTGNRIGSGTVNTEYNALKTILQQSTGRDPNATAGSATRESCNICNPAFGQTVSSGQCRCPANRTEAAGTGYGSGQGCTVVPAGAPTNQLSNDLFSDIQPMRSAKEAVKNFGKLLDPKFDQLGFVTFSVTVNNSHREKLQCLRFAQKLWNDRSRCYDPTNTNVISYTNIFRAIEPVDNSGNTNIAQGMVEGLEELGVNTPFNSGITSDCILNSTTNGQNLGSDNKRPCDRRGGARRVLILMTDGSPNEPDSNSYCPSGSLPASATWQGIGGGTVAYNCAIYYAQQAANNGVTVYTIGIGAGVNQDLLRVMAEGKSTVPGHTKVYIEGAKGKFYLASTQADLDQIFKDILNNVVVRLVG